MSINKEISKLDENDLRKGTLKARKLVGTLGLAWLVSWSPLEGQPINLTNMVPSQGGAVLVDIGPHSRTWHLRGAPTVELATGMNYWDGKNWRPSDAKFELSTDAFTAAKIQHKVRLNANINAAGSVSIMTPDGLLLNSTPVGIGLYDPVSGDFVLVGTITNSVGALLGQNQVIYENAFHGACASMVYTIENGSFEQDVVFTGRLDAADYGFATGPGSRLRLQIITELYAPPQPDVIMQPFYVETDPVLRQRMASPDLMDETIGFGEFVLGIGRAYIAASPAAPNGAGVAVAKELVKSEDGRILLVESVDYLPLQQALLSLPDCLPPGATVGVHSKTNLKKGYASIATPPKKGLVLTQRLIPALTKAQKKPQGVVIDYIATISGGLNSTFVFAADTNYFISGNVFCNAATTIESTVLKYKTNTSVRLNNALTCKTAMYRPAIFTGVDDDTVGDSLSTITNSSYVGSINPNGYANPALIMIQTSLSLTNFRFCYAQQGVRYTSPSANTAATLNVNHSQFVKCIRGIEIDFGGAGTGTGLIAVNVNNSLMSGVQYPIYVNAVGNQVNCALANCTLDQVNTFIGGSGNFSVTGASTNSIYANITNATSGVTLAGKFNGFYTAAQTFGSSQISTTNYPFQSVGAGNYYLSDASGFRSAGTTTDIPGTLLSDLKKRTTYPPSVISSTNFNTSQTYSPIVQREPGSPPSLGFHYDPIDLALGAVAFSNATMTVNAGTIIATFGTNNNTRALLIGQGGVLSSTGTPNNPNWFVQFNTVQEQAYINWTRTTNGMISSEYQGAPQASTINCRFTDFSMVSLDSPSFMAPTNTGPINFQDCEFHAGKLTSWRPTINLTNCLLERVLTDLEPKDGGTNYMRNCLVYGGNFIFAPSNSLVRDNLFDKTTITNWNGYTGGFNAYITNLSRLAPATNDIILSASPSYQAGPLGYYYQLNSSVLINADTNTTADQVGLYHYTVVTNIVNGSEIKETNSPVDISYHYVAVNTNGLPVDTDGDGLPDYLEDKNGNGNFDPGETDWRDPSPTVSITVPSNGQLFFISPTNISITATASDNSAVTNLAFYNGTNLIAQIGTNTASLTYTITWSNVIGGTYSLTAKATDNEGAVTTSSPVIITVNGGLDFGTNNAYVSFGSNTNLNVRGFTLECWFKRNATGITTNTGTGGVTAVPLITKGRAENDTGQTNMNYFLGIGTNNVLVADFKEFPNGAHHVVSGLTTIANGVWYHAAVTFNGTNLQVYLDGNLEGTLGVGQLPEFDCIQHAALATTLDTKGTAAGFFYGVMDEVRIWSYGRSQQQIRDNMSLTDASDCGLLAHWGLDDGQGTTVSNSTSIAAGGTINGTGWSWSGSAPYNASGAVLFVVGSTTLSSGDSAISNHLQSLGYFITVKSDSGAAATDGNGKNFIVISSSVNPANVNTKFTTNSVPVITWRQDLYDDLGMVTSNSSYYGTISAQTQLNVIGATHPLAAGLIGPATVDSSSSTFAWGAPNSNAVLIATTSSNTTNYAIFAYEKGAAMPGLVAPARRVGLFFSDNTSMASLNSSGWALFDAAVNWVITPPCPQALEVMFVMDYTASMKSNSIYGGPLLQEETNDAIYFVTNLNLNLDRAGVVAFVSNSPNTMLLCPLTNNSAAIGNAINSLTNPGSFTRIDLGFTAAQWQFTSNHVGGAEQIVLFFSDGLPESGFTNAAYAMNGFLRQNGARVVSFGLGNYVNTMLMPDMASTPCDYHWEADNNTLASVLASINNSVCRNALNHQPAVSITSPINGQVFVFSPTNITLTATASDPDGTISKVEFFSGSTNLGVATWLSNSIYQLVWNNMSNGTYTVTARATDNAGSTMESQPVTFTVNAMPLVRITTPTNFQSFLEVTNVSLNATASDPDGSISKVQFFFNTNLLGTATLVGTNYSFTWSSRLAGYYPITAVATDNAGATNVSSIVVFQVLNTNSGPSISITNPVNGAVLQAGVNLAIQAQASGTNGVPVTNVEFFQSSVLLGNDSVSPYEIDLQGLSPGTYTFTALATDSNGLQKLSAPVTVTVQNWKLVSGSGYWDSDFQAGNFFDLRYDDVSAACVDSSNSVFVSTSAGNISPRLGYWQWQSCGWSVPPNLGNLNPAIHVIQYRSPYLYAGGGNGVQSWTWSGQINDLTLGLDNAVWALQFIKGELYAGGDFMSAGTNTAVQYIAELVGNAWVPVGNGLNGRVHAIASIGDAIYAGGEFTTAGTNSNLGYLAKLVGTNWVALGSGVTNIVRALAVWNGKLLVGGDFTQAGGNTNASGIALWDGTSWSSIGCGVAMPGSSPQVKSIAVWGNDVFVGGVFSTVQNGTNVLSSSDVAQARWDVDQQKWIWTAMDLGVSLPGSQSRVDSLAIRPNSTTNGFDVIAAGFFNQAGLLSSVATARWVVSDTDCTNAGPPTVAFDFLPDGSTFYGITSLPLRADAFAAPGAQILGLNFYSDGAIIHSGDNGGSGSTYSFTWNTGSGLVNGTHRLDAVAWDNQGLTNKATVTISINPTNTPAVWQDAYTLFANDPPTPLYVLMNDSNVTAIASVSSLRGDLGTVSIAPGATNLIFSPARNAYGQNTFFYTATNSSGAAASTLVSVTILSRPFVQITSPVNGLSTNAPVTLAVGGATLGYDGTVTNIQIFTNGVQYVALAPVGNNFSTNLAFSNPGFYTCVAIATDNYGSSNSSPAVGFDVKSTSPNNHPPVALITSPTPPVTNMATLTITNAFMVSNGKLALTGSAYDPDAGDPVAYQVVLLDPANPNGQPLYNVTPGPVNAQGFHSLQSGIVNASLGTADLTLVQNGTYLLMLVVQGGGDQSTASLLIGVGSNLKIGQFSFSEQDLVLPVNGIPLTVVRTYNSLNPLSADFGYGWTYSINSMDVQLDDQRTNVTIGSAQAPFADVEEDANGKPLIVSIRTGGGLDVSLNLPDGRRTTFAFSPRMAPSDCKAYAQWTPPPDVHATLIAYPPGSEVINVVPFLPPFWNDGGADSTFANHDIPGWMLQTADGTHYYITRGSVNHVYYDTTGNGNWAYVPVYGSPSLTSIQQRTGDLVTIGPSGIFHYAGTNGLSTTNLTRSAGFTRDSQNRITAIYDPNAGANGFPVLQYIYNQDTGNLLQVLKLIDRVAGTYSTNKYHYDNATFPHYITKIENANGVPVAQNYYDSTGRLTEVVDANRFTNQFVHNLSGNQEILIDPLGHTNIYTYDLHGNTTATTNALNGITLMAYDSSDNKTNEIVFLNGARYATNKYSYDANGSLLSSVNPLGFVTSFNYNQFEQVTNTVDARNASSTNYYDANGNLTGTSDGFGNSTTNYYNGDGQLVASTDTLGTATTNFYDSWGNLTASSIYGASSSGSAILSTNTFGYDADGNRTNSTNWRRVGISWTSASTKYIYDGQNRLVQTIDPDGGTNIVVFDPAGRQQATINKLWHTNTFVYDFRGRLTTTVYADRTTQLITYDANGNRLTTVDQGQRTNSYTYDAMNRLMQTTFQDTTTSTTFYDDLGRVKFTVDSRGITNAFGYDVAGRRLAFTNAWGTSIQITNGFGFDQNGNQVILTDGLGRSITNVFDALNRQTQVQYPDNTFVLTVFDSGGRPTWLTNQDLLVTRFAYDGLGRLLAVTNGLGGTQTNWVQYQYDEAGNQTAQIDALNHTTSFAYDSMGRRTGKTLPGTQSESYTYDLVGNLTRTISFNGVLITNVYDSLNRLINRSCTNGYSVSFGYSPTSQRTNMIDPSGTTSYVYDNRDRLMQKTVTWSNGPSIALNYSYDGNGNLTNLWSSSSTGVTNVFQYDALNRLTNVVASGSTAAGYGFDANGNLQSLSYGNGVSSIYQYDALNRLTNLSWSSHATNIATFYYQLGATGNRTNLSENLGATNRTFSWQYDSLYRLTQETIGGGGPIGTVSYGYDKVGNRSSRTVTNTPLNQILTNQNFTFDSDDRLGIESYDSNGNTLTSPGNSYKYNIVSQLTNAGPVVLNYDGDGNRTVKTIGSTTVFYLTDDRNPSGYTQVIEEWTASGGTTNLTRLCNYGLQLISQKQNSTLYYFCKDGHGSTRGLLDSNATISQPFTYDGYGALIASNGTAPSTPYLYDGEYLDTDLGTYYLRSRVLNHGIGRFLTMDNFQGDREQPSSLHKYLFCHSDPLNNIDPLGLWENTDFGNRVQEVITDDFIAEGLRKGVYRDGNLAVGTMVGRPAKGSLAIRPDLFQKDNKDNFFYEIKSASPPQIAAGLLKVALYNSYLNYYGPWRPGGPSDYIYWPAQTGPIITKDRNGLPLPGGYVALVLPPAGGLMTYVKIDGKTPRVVLKWAEAIAFSSALSSLEVGASSAAVTATSVSISSLATTATASTQIGTVVTVSLEADLGVATASATMGGL
jgi:RHS repeat-associated protein